MSCFDTRMTSIAASEGASVGLNAEVVISNIGSYDPSKWPYLEREGKPVPIDAIASLFSLLLASHSICPSK